MKIPESSGLPRISWRSIAGDILEQLNLERGLGYTIRQLILRPRQAMQEYLFEDRRRMMKPFPLLLLTVGVATYLSMQFLLMGEDLATELQKDPDLEKVPQRLLPLINWLTIATKQYFNLFYMSTLPATALATYWIFGGGLHLAEHLVINIYLFCIQTLAYLLFVPFLLSAPWLGIPQLLLTWGYVLYAYNQIFDQPLWSGIGRGLLVQLVGQAVYLVMVVMLAGIAWLVYFR